MYIKKLDEQNSLNPHLLPKYKTVSEVYYSEQTDYKVKTYFSGNNSTRAIMLNSKADKQPQQKPVLMISYFNQKGSLPKIKANEEQTKEDLLTSTVMDLLKYLPDSVLLQIVSKSLYEGQLKIEG